MSADKKTLKNKLRIFLCLLWYKIIIHFLITDVAHAETGRNPSFIYKWLVGHVGECSLLSFFTKISRVAIRRLRSLTLWRDLLPHLGHLSFCPHGGKRERTEPRRALPLRREKRPSFTLPFVLNCMRSTLCPVQARQRRPSSSAPPQPARTRPLRVSYRAPGSASCPRPLCKALSSQGQGGTRQVLQWVVGTLPSCPKDPQGQLHQPGTSFLPSAQRQAPSSNSSVPLLLACQRPLCHWDPSLYSRPQARGPSPIILTGVRWHLITVRFVFP